jgi:CotH kinase protein/Lamin Tail Domain/Secretion system C-terminal sorting domain
MKRYPSVVCFLICTFLYSYSQTFTDSNLPIVIINTDGGITIPDSPRIFASMKIISRGAGLRNWLTDQTTPAYLNYDGRINIEIRGSSSQTLPKNQYGFTTYKKDNITKSDVPLLGLPKDNDWILNGLGYEPSLMRDYLCYNLSRMMGQYASRTVYCEVMINGSYQGLYVLQEKIKQGSNRVNVMKIEPADNFFPDITGGYITKADKTNDDDPAAWRMSSYVGTNDVSYIHVLPKPLEVTPDQSAYIYSEFEKLSNTASAGNSSLESGYPTIIDIPSFVDFMIISEFSANADAYQFSTYFHKDRNGKLRAGPIWDNNLTFGNDLTIWGFDRSKTNTWQFANGDNVGSKFWKDLYANPDFICCLWRRWNQLIQPGQPLNQSVIEALIDQTAATINEAAIRENAKWGTIHGLSGEITKIKDFVKARTAWMTTNISSSTNCGSVEVPQLVITKIMYNPDSSAVFPKSKDQEFIEIQNTGNTTANLTGVYFSGTGFVYQFPAHSEMHPGAIKILASNPIVFIAKYGTAPSGQFTRNLANEGENLVLADAFGNVIDSVSYSNLPPWPNADGNGYYLELIDPLTDNSIASNWTASRNTIVSVKETETGNGLKIYPTPVKDNLNIESSGQIEILELFDFQGRLIRKIDVNSEHYTLNMSFCYQGIYLIQVITPGRNYIQKIIKE